MKTHRNPFTTLYVTERLDQADFPALFSPVLVPHITPLFEAGSVVVKGTQGTGKSMLLALLQTEVRLAYAESQAHEYPIDDPKLCQFICAGINLSTNQAMRSAARWSGGGGDRDDELRLCFVDYVNSWILRDLLKSIDTLISRPGSLWNPLQLGGSREAFEKSLQLLADDPGIPIQPSRELTAQSAFAGLSKRIDSYLRFFNGRPKELPEEILESQTQSLGQPVADAVEVLKQGECLARSTRVLIMLDQFEQLLEMEAGLPNRPYGLLRDTIEQALHRREATLSFRIGTRPYAWQSLGGEAVRDYFALNLDDILARKEHGNRKLFPNLASDVFARRLRSYGYQELAEVADPLRSALGPYPPPGKRIKHIGTNVDWSERISIPKQVDAPIADRLRALAASEPLEAKLGVAWALQKAENVCVEDFAVEGIGDLPWNQEKKKWWKKERLPLAMLQLASDNRQKVVMFGKKDVLDLSGGNILVFASICQHIWERWIRHLAIEKISKQRFPIDRNLQTDGILSASTTWHEKIAEERWIGDNLLAFIDELGNWLCRMLKADEAMSYPGGNGISLANRDLLAFPQVRQILSEASGRGFLLQRRHTPKRRERGESTKWYLHPVLAPYYEVTLNHTKEPRYVSGADVQNWVERAGISTPAPPDEFPPPTETAPSHNKQLKLPGVEDAAP